MGKRRYSDEQIIKILKESESGVKTSDLCRTYGMSEQSFYKWKAKYGGMELSDVKKMKLLEEENRKLKKLVAEQALDIMVLKDLNSKNW